MARMTIELAGLELFGYHGVLSEEREQGQRFLVDVWLELTDPTAGVTDLIDDAVDYRRVAAVREISNGRAYHLLQAFASARRHTPRTVPARAGPRPCPQAGREARSSCRVTRPWRSIGRATDSRDNRPRS